MPLKPRITVEDNYVDGLTCAFCESAELQVSHVDNYPDFVTCGNCASAFVVEDEGSWIMYGKVNDDLPETSEFALRQWTWLDSVRQRAQDERAAQRGETLEQPPPVPPLEQEDQAALEEVELTLPDGPESEKLLRAEQAPSPDFMDEITKLEEPLPKAEDPTELPEAVESVELASVFDDLGPDHAIEPQTAEQEEPSVESLFPEAEELKLPDDIPLDPDHVEGGLLVEDTPPSEVDEVELSRLEQVTASPEDMVSDTTAEEQSSPPISLEERAAEDEGLPIPKWLEQKPASAADELFETPPFSEGGPEKTTIDDETIVPPFVDDSAKPSPVISAESDIAPTTLEPDLTASTEPADFLDPISEPTPPSEPFLEKQDLELPPISSSETVEEIAGLEEVDEPIEEHLLPPWARQEGAAVEPASGEVSAPEPLPFTTGEPITESEDISDPFPFTTEETAPSEGFVGIEQEAVPDQEPELPTGEPEGGFRYRIVVKGDQLTFPKNVCAHCLQMQVSLAAAVRGTLPDPEQPGMRKPLTFKLPLCRNCENRAKASTDEERSAKIQAHAISGIVAIFMIVIILIAGIASFEPNALEGIMVLLIVGVLSYAIPAVLLLNRASSYPPPYDAAYVLTTLRVADDAGDEVTAFEWRNQGYAELFRQVNRRNAEDSISKVEDLMMLIEPPLEESLEEPEVTIEKDEGTIKELEPTSMEPVEESTEEIKEQEESEEDPLAPPLQ